VALAVLASRALSGFEAPPVTVEVHLAGGLPSFTIVGLPDTEVKEARDRVRAALQNSRFEFPARRITVNLAPAELPKEGGGFDLPIALGILVASGQLSSEHLGEYEFAGELSLSGELRAIRGALAMTYRASRSGRRFLLPAASADEAALVGDAQIYGADSLLAVCAHLAGETPLARHARDRDAAAAEYPDLADVKGQRLAKRALEIAAAGSHSLLLAGPPGTGKSMLAQRLPGILPPMTDDEALEAAAVQSLGVAGFDAARWRQRPYRAPHHSASAAALVGGGGGAKPGEITLAHRGVLFLDELPEFQRSVLEVMREPLESGHITISRAARQAEYPARFQLVAAMNPCPCGYLGAPAGRCRCTPDQIARYRNKLSGPLLDRIDMHVEVPAVPEAELLAQPAGEPSAAVRERVVRARERAVARQGKPNAELAAAEVDTVCAPDDAGQQLLKTAIARLDLSARAFHRILKLARTIADVAGADAVGAAHVAEAIQFRRGL
jgi:magnesium chelatase family protein